MTIRVSGGVFNNQVLTGSLKHYRINGADFSGAVSDGTATIPDGGGPGIDIIIPAGDPVPGSASEEIFDLIQQEATVVIMNPKSFGLYFALENGGNGWASAMDIQICINMLGTIGVDNVDVSQVTVQEIEYILGAAQSFLELSDTPIDYTNSAGKIVIVNDTEDALVFADSPVPSGITITDINGQPTLTLIDTTRNNKVLSVAEQSLVFAENRLSHLDWMQIGNARSSETSYVSDFNGTIVFASAHCEESNANSKDVRLFVNSSDRGIVGTLGPGPNSTFNRTTLNQDVNMGDRIRLRAYDNTTGAIQDTVVKLTLKWRG